MRVLVVEDHSTLAGRIAQGLRQAGMAVDAVYDGGAALEAAAQTAYDVIVLDRDLPVVHGDRVCRAVAGSGPRVLMLTAAGNVEDRVDGLELGADDYLGKPFVFAELVARVRALSRRAPSAPPVLRRGDLSVDRARHRASRGSRSLSLTRKEFGVLEILMAAEGAATASTWGSVTEDLARIGRVIAYDRRGYARSGGEPVRRMSIHTADAAALMEHLRTPPAVVVGTSAGAAIAVDLAVRRPDLVRVVVAHEFPWRFTRHLPTASQVAALAKIGSLALRGRHGDAAEVLLRTTYTYPDGGNAWDAFPEQWRRVARENARAALADFRNSIVAYPAAADLATIKVPVVCSYGSRSANNIVGLVHSLAEAIPTATTRQIEGAGHAAPFDATTNFVHLIADSITISA